MIESVWLVGKITGTETRWLEWYPTEEQARKAGNYYRNNNEAEYTIRRVTRGTKSSKLENFTEVSDNE